MLRGFMMAGHMFNLSVSILTSRCQLFCMSYSSIETPYPWKG